MRLTIADKQEIKGIIASLDERDHERIYEEVERLAKASNPITSLLRKFQPDEHTTDAVDYLSGDDIDFQENVEKWRWDALTARVTAEYAIGVFKAKHEHREAA
ncbi:hypothetical protein [Enterobacter sp. R1(2018)]|uniref:hypothetical protein n=1 Tax=Enterobacter sp. R1(2018) TaxID=2447891 RepID=UPI000EAC1888|nr:hypothetical protein [Enterobacter sp. R1(2018)]RKQ38358.1 hypothetical protein D8M09_17265 [Enterobacter sp. R1(2018)]